MTDICYIDANNLIASLKREIADLRKTSSSSTTESARLKSEVATLQTAADKAKEEAKTNSTALLEATNEVKSLTAKLDAARKSSQIVSTDKTPGSAMKSQTRGQLNGGGGLGSEATKYAAMKEELYRDLTGLIINSVKRRDGEDEFSCIQTGRNGSKFSSLRLYVLLLLICVSCSTSLSPHNLQRQQRHNKPKDSLGLELRRHRVCI